MEYMFLGCVCQCVLFLPHIKKIALEFYKSIAKRYIAVYVGRHPVFLEPRHRITGHAQGHGNSEAAEMVSKK